MDNRHEQMGSFSIEMDLTKESARNKIIYENPFDELILKLHIYVTEYVTYEDKQMKCQIKKNKETNH